MSGGLWNTFPEGRGKDPSEVWENEELGASRDDLHGAYAPNLPTPSRSGPSFFAQEKHR
jgi:hypothetical protein